MRAKRSVLLCIGMLAGMSLVVAGQSAPGVVQRTVQEAIALGLEHYPDVRQAELGLQLAELELAAARAKAMIPSVDLKVSPPSLSTGGFSGNVVGGFSLQLPLPWGTSSLVSAGLDLAWDPLTGEWDESTWEVSFSQSLDFSQPSAGSKDLVAKEEAVEDARAALETARNSVVRMTVETYGNLLEEQALLSQAEADVAQAEANLKQQQELVKAGLAGESSLVQARLNLLDVEITQSERQSTYAADKASFGRQVLGMDGDYTLVSFQPPVEALKKAASSLLAEPDLLASAVGEASEVKTAKRTIEDAKETLQAARLAALPSLSFKAGVTDQGWQLGVNLVFSLFSPTRGLDVKIAETNLAMAEDKLAAAQEEVRDRLLTQQAALRAALARLDRLPMEQEKWTLDETVTRAKWEAGSLSDEDWQTFLEEKRAFLADADQRGITLLVAFLACRDGLGLELNVEEWLK